MSTYKIITDSACDMKADVLASWDVDYAKLHVKFTDSDKDYLDGELDLKEFYGQMRNGRVATTSAVNIEDFKQLFEKYLKQGQDVVYLGFSSGLSGTFNSGRMAVEELKQDYPDRKIVAIDTFCASGGQGLIVYLATKKRDEGASFDELVSYVNDMLPKMAHWFTVDDLVYLKRGGRVSPTAAFVGDLLGIKPVLHVDDEGHLINMSKVKGRKASMKAIISKVTETVENPADGTYILCTGDCDEDAKIFCDMFEKAIGKKIDILSNVGTVIGAHTGPSIMAFFFVAKNR